MKTRQLISFTRMHGYLPEHCPATAIALPLLGTLAASKGGLPSSGILLMALGWFLHVAWLSRKNRIAARPAGCEPAAEAARPVPPASRPAGTPDRPALHALIVDDHPINLLLTRDLLAGLGIGAETAGSGHEALEIAAARRFDIVFLDVQMPEMDGMEVCAELHRIWGLDSPPVIALTAHAFPHEREQFLAAGMDECLTKPISGTHLGACLQRWLPASNARTNTQHFHSQAAGAAAIDRDACVRLAGGKPELARELIMALVDTLPANVAEIYTAARCRDEEWLRSQLHKLLGACRYAGVPGLLEQSAELHRLSLQRQEAVDTQAVEPLLREAVRVLQDAYNWLARSATDSSTTKATA